ncbi:pfkB_family carbohydrate kinase protein [Hexamita inflata]|uniref:PfkB family carbohydrate kinase protein n=1 Tax=Hexamita inflata TaxID=28002 RepID=A0AA86VJ98_9EUKA|nr:pfkB family carbohydrate kinase protein [Hexamita inflata]
MLVLLINYILTEETEEQAATQKVEVEEQEKAPVSKGAAFYGSAVVDFSTKPVASENKSANATLGFGFTGPARNAAEVFANLGDEKAKLFTLLGDDSLGGVMKSDLLKKKVNVNFIETDPKLPTASVITMNVEQSVLAKIVDNTSTSNDTNLTQIVQLNGDILHKVAYKYLYPHIAHLNDSELIYTDLKVNENSAKAMIQNFGSKLFVQVAGAENLQKYVMIIKNYFDALKANKKLKQSKYLVNSVYLTLEEAVGIPTVFCSLLSKDEQNIKDACKNKDANLTELFIAGYEAENKKKVPYADYLKTHSADLVNFFQILHTTLKAQTVFVRIPGAAVLTSTNSTERISYTEHNCMGKCIVNENGADEAFIAGFMYAHIKGKRIDDCLEFASFAQITSLKTADAVNQQLDEKMLKKMTQNTFVSYKILHDSEDAATMDGQEVKGEL